MKKLILQLICFMYLVGCQSTIKDKIIDEIEKNCESFSEIDDCILSLKELTDFDWDKMYVFSGFYTPEDIHKIIGTECKCNMLSDDYSRLLFVYKGKVVYMEEYYLYANKRIQFREINGEFDQFSVYTPHTANFFVLKRVKGSNPQDYFYDFFPIEGTLKPKY